MYHNKQNAPMYTNQYFLEYLPSSYKIQYKIIHAINQDGQNYSQLLFLIIVGVLYLSRHLKELSSLYSIYSFRSPTILFFDFGFWHRLGVGDLEELQLLLSPPSIFSSMSDYSETLLFISCDPSKLFTCNTNDLNAGSFSSRNCILFSTS